MKQTVFRLVFSAMALAAGIQPCAAQDETVDITRFEVEGNTLLPASQIQGLLSPLSGPNKVYGDIQRALEALENAYRQAGYSAVQVYVPEQELKQGVVKLQVTENTVGQILISGNEHFERNNILASLPALQPGQTPNMRDLSENIRLVNENAAKQLEVTLGVAEQEGQLDAKVKVTDRAPGKFSLTLDNTGTEATGKWRTGVAYQHANLFDRDHVGSLAYTTSPDSPSGVKVDIYSLGYRLPLYGVGDSIDLIYGKSSVNTPSSSTALGGALGILGKGDVLGLRYNHFLPRQGDYAAKVIFGLDDKNIDARCTDANGNPLTNVGSCLPYTTRPLSLSYNGQRVSPGQMLDYTVSYAYNLATGPEYSNNGRTDRYSYLTTGTRPTIDNFSVLRASGSYFMGWANDWQARIAASLQYTDTPLVAAEQFGLVGSSAVRGFNERAVSADGGALLNLELYTPDLAKLMGWESSLRVLLFYDTAQGYNRAAASASIPVPEQVSASGSGIGLRYALGKDLSLRADYAQVIHAGPSTTEKTGDWRGHVSVMVSF